MTKKTLRVVRRAGVRVVGVVSGAYSSEHELPADTADNLLATFPTYFEVVTSPPPTVKTPPKKKKDDS